MSDSDPFNRRRLLSLILLFTASFVTSCSKRAEPAPKPHPPPPFEFLGAWGDKGEDPGKLDQPVAFATDETNRVLFVDPAAEFVDKFESNGTPLLSFQDSRLRHASGIAVDSGGAIYVADATHGIVMIYFPDGTFLRSVVTEAQPHFSGPLGISVDINGNLYVPDPAHSRVEKFDSHGRQVKFWPAPSAAIQKNSSEKKTTQDEGTSFVATTQDGFVFVAYSASGRIEKYSPEGDLLTSWIATDNPPNEARPLTGLVVSGHFVFTMTAASPQIRVWTLDGQHKMDADLGAYLGAGPISAPQIAITTHSELLVFDPSAPHVFWFRMHLETSPETKEQK